MRITLIAATDPHRVIGRRNDLPWDLPADLERFKNRTLGKPIVMGRKTYESIGRPLPGRTNVVLTRRERFSAPGCRVVSSLEAALEECAGAGETMVIGGAAVYATAMGKADRLLLTVIHRSFEGDTYFPEPSPERWKIDRIEDFPPEQGYALPHSLYTLTRSTRPGGSLDERASRFPCPEFLEEIPGAPKARDGARDRA